jgi:hypothetical protein
VSTNKPEYWRKLIAEQEGGGQEVRPFCRESGITEPSFYYWRKRLRKCEPVRFALLEPRPADTGGTISALELVLTSISFQQKVYQLILLERLELLPAVDDGSSVDFLDAFAYPGFEFCERLDPDMAQKASRHFAEQSLDDIQPGAMLRR